MSEEIKVIIEEENKDAVIVEHTETAIEAAATIVETAQDLAKEMTRPDDATNNILVAIAAMHSEAVGRLDEVLTRLRQIEDTLTTMQIIEAIDDEDLEDKIDEVIKEVKTVEAIEDVSAPIVVEDSENVIIEQPKKRERKWL